MKCPQCGAHVFTDGWLVEHQTGSLYMVYHVANGQRDGYQAGPYVSWERAETVADALNLHCRFGAPRRP